MQVREIMNAQIKQIQPAATVQEAARLMRDEDIGVLPVLDGENVVGMVTDRDLCIRVLADGLSADKMSVEDVMTPDLLSCKPDDSVESAAELMAQRQVHRLLVMEDKKLVGMLSLADLALSDEFAVDQAMEGIAEKRHDEPGVELNH